MGSCFSKEKEEDDENKPLLGDKKDGKDKELKDSANSKPAKSSRLKFTRLEVQEFDRIFDDFARTMNPFVTDRENLENAVTKFKTTVESIHEVRPNASFREYVKTLKTTLKDEGMFIKIKNGAVEVYGVGSRSVTAGKNAVDAIKKIITAGEGLKKMPDLVVGASRSAVADTESGMEGLEQIIRREFSGVFDICKINRFRKNLKNNLKQLKSSPKMVKDFCEEVMEIIEEINKAFDEDKSEENDNENEERGEATNKDDNDPTEDGKKKEKKLKEKASGDKDDQDEDAKDDDQTKKKDDKKKEDKKKDGKKKDDKKKDDKKKDDKKKKEDLQKQLKMDNVGIPDIDKIFSDVMTTLNRFVNSREKLQSARESFEKIMKTLVNFDGEKEFKDYVNELKKKAKEGDIHIYIDTSDGDIKLDKVNGVDPPAPYRNAVKALNDVKTAARSVEELEPSVQSGLESCGKDVAKVEPLKDFKKMVSGAKEVMAIPKKVKAFNENRKKVQKAPQIVKEFCVYVKGILVDIVKVFCEDDEEKKEDEKKGNEEEKEDEKKGNEEEKEDEKKENESEEKEKESGEEKNKESAGDTQKIMAEVHQPRKAESAQENENKNIEV